MLIEVDPVALKKVIGESIQDFGDNKVAMAKDIYAKIDAFTRRYESQLPNPEDFYYVPTFDTKED